MKTEKIMQTAGICAVLLAVQTASAADIYECRQNGSISYSQVKGKNCKPVRLGHSSTYSSVKPVVRQTESTPEPARDDNGKNGKPSEQKAQ